MKTALKPGTLIAEGDSWFDYPGTDILEELEDNHGYDVKSVAHKGDTVESMAYGEKQLDKLAKQFWKLHQKDVVPQAVLLSGGGNDIAGDEFPLLLNHSDSDLPALNDDIVRGLVDVRLREALIRLARTVTSLCDQVFDTAKPIRILLHGYDYSVPDGRGFWGGWGPLPGPWLEPGFEQKGYFSLKQNAAVMKVLLDRFNTMVATLPKVNGLGHLRYVDLRGCLSSSLVNDRYKTWWDNELHPEDKGYRVIAARFHAAIVKK
jgi:lysophospholipase L1-like esterase